MKSTQTVFVCSHANCKVEKLKKAHLQSHIKDYHQKLYCQGCRLQFVGKVKLDSHLNKNECSKVYQYNFCCKTCPRGDFAS